MLHNQCLQLLLRHEDVPREILNNAYVDFFFSLEGVGGGGVEVYYGICASRELMLLRIPRLFV